MSMFLLRLSNLREHMEDLIYARTRNDPPCSHILVSATDYDDDDGWVTIGYGNLFRR